MKKVGGVLTDVKESDLKLLSKNPHKFWKNIICIGKSAFSGLMSLKNIDIPNTVTHIADEAFFNCNNLIEVSLPESLTSIGNKAFKRSALSGELIIPDSVTIIGNNAFEDLDRLTKVKFPENLKYIGNNAFNNCYNLAGDIIIPDSMDNLGDYAFQGSKIESVSIGNNLTYIGNNAFNNCRSLKSLKIGNRVATIGIGAFNDCGLSGELIIPNNVINIGASAFEGNEFNSIIIGSGVKDIGLSAFLNRNGCKRTIMVDEYNPKFTSRDNSGNECNCIIERQTQTLICGANNKDAKIPDDGSVTKIESFAFANCSELTNLYLPGSIEKIETNSFGSCTNLKYLIMPYHLLATIKEAFYDNNSIYTLGNLKSLTLTRQDKDGNETKDVFDDKYFIKILLDGGTAADLAHKEQIQKGYIKSFYEWYLKQQVNENFDDYLELLGKN